jgi:MYXO-CTERM domain-containing protein
MKSVYLLATMAGCAAAASAGLVDFNDLSHGDVVAEQYASMGVHISAVNPNRPFDIAMAFDTTSTGNSDDDLEDPWSMGNMDLNTNLGNILIIQENDSGIPDDEATRPAGSIVFDFDSLTSGFGFTMVDVESVTLEGSSVDFYRGGLLIESINFAEFEAGGTHDNGVIFGNNSINNSDEQIISGGFDQAIIHAGGSMGFDNISFTTVPAPGSLALLALGAATGIRRRR